MNFKLGWVGKYLNTKLIIIKIENLALYPVACI